MKAFQMVPKIQEYDSFSGFAADAALGPRDLVMTNAYLREPVAVARARGCQLLFQEQYGAGEPTDLTADAILETLSGKDYDRLIAAGGGTVIDLAKVAAVAAPGDRVDDLYGRMGALEKRHPLLIAPTTCGTGSEMTNISIISRTSIGMKQGLVSPAMYADQAVLIPALLDSLPYGVYAASAVDAMIHAVESWLSPNSCPLSRLFSEQALSLILPCWQAGKDWKPYAAEFLRASNYAGIAFAHAGCAAVHALSYPLGSIHHVPHGEANWVMFEPVMRKYAEKQPTGRLERFRELAAGLLGCPAGEALEALFALTGQVLARRPMRAYGVAWEELPEYADLVVGTQQRLLGNNLVPLTREEILAVYESAF